MTTSWLQRVAYLLLVLTYSAVASPPFSRKTACPHKDGFEWRSDIRWKAGSGATTVGGHSSLSATEAACRNDAQCKAFNNLGEILRGNINSLTVVSSNYVGTCVYLKRSSACPERSGYQLLMYTSWQVASGSRNVRANPISSAPTTCDADSTCVAFNSNGDMLVGVVEKLIWSSTTCAYLKTSALGAVCPPLYGYEAKQNFEVVGSDGMSGTAMGPLLDVSQAREACQVNPKCSAWDSSGNIAIGGIDSYTPKLGTCAYVKNSCVPRAGFIAYADLTFDSTPSDGHFPELCGNDIYSKCLNDPTCQGYNTLRHIWTSVKPSPNTEFSGMCTYVRAPGY
ncbi:hypothetical protein VaNZ11_015432 [Volvox africanus]|uniref:Uncharacterized protein n=1 Tax=Volvox africanus TaxID=51714 RepID=A0ABQ5SN14_9CHLO|nr:hypothetical protein VaNZ11_015432 [Volvox africanus]